MKIRDFVNAKRIFSVLAVVLVLVCGISLSVAAEGESSLEVGTVNLKYSTNTHIIVTLNGEVAEGLEKGIAVWRFDVSGELTADNISYVTFDEEYDAKGVEFFPTFGIPASELSEKLAIAPAVKDAEGNVTLAGEIVKYSAFDYVEARLAGELKGYQVDLYRDLVVYGTASEQVLGDKVANNNVVVAKGGYVGEALFPFAVTAEGETALLRALAVNAKGEYFSHWEDMLGNFVSGERLVTVEVDAGVNYYNAVYTDKTGSPYAYFADFSGFEAGEYDFTVGNLTDAEKTAGKAALILPMLPNKDGALLGFRKMMTFDPAALEGLSSTDKIPATASDSLSIESIYDGTKYLNYVKDADASYGYAVGSVFDTSGSTDQTDYDRFEMDISIPHAANLPTMYLRFTENSRGLTSDIILNLGRSIVSGVPCFRIIYQTTSGDKSLYVPDNGGSDVISLGVDIDANGVCNLYVNGEKATLEAPIARLYDGSYVEIPAGNYNPVCFRFENSSGFNYNYEIYSIGLVDTDKIKEN